MYIAKTDYTLNRKKKDAIVCKTAVGNYVLLKREDFANDEEFEKWKAWSDEDYHISENATRRTSRKNVMLSEKVDNEICCLSAEDTLCEKLENLEHINKACRMKELLTETQYRRLWLYAVKGISMPKIAKMEEIGRASCRETIYGARKKIKKRLSEFTK